MQPYNPADRVLIGIGGPLDSIALNLSYHIEASLGSPITLPALLSDAMAEHGTDKVSGDLCTLFTLMSLNVHTGGYRYAYQALHFGGDDSSLPYVHAYLFYRVNGYHSGDPYYSSDSYIVIGDNVFALTDNDNVAECGILESTVGFWASPLRPDCDANLLDPINNGISAGYSSYPYGILESYLESGEFYVARVGGNDFARRIPKAYWIESRQCYVAKLKGIPYLCKIEPVAPFYGG